MWPRLKAEDFKIIGHYLGYLVVFMAVVMLIPFSMAIAQANYDIAANYAFGIGFALVMGFALCMLKINTANLKRRQAVVITALAWVVCAFFAAIPLYLSGHYNSYFDSFLDGISSFTTTGFSFVNDLEHMSPSDVMWRFIMQFIGGLGIVVVALSIGAFVRSGSRASLYYAEGRHDHVMPEIKKTVRFIAVFSLSIVAIGTAVMTIILLYKGMGLRSSLFNGAGVTIAAYATGGATVNSTGLVYYHSWALELVAIVIMLLGSISLMLYVRAFKGRVADFFKNFELRVYAVWIVVLLVTFVIMMGLGSHFLSTDTILRKAVFTLLSGATSTGFSLLSPAQMAALMPMGAFTILACAMAVGGMSESMAGGLKVMRLGVILKDMVTQIKQVLLPDSVKIVPTYENVGRKPLTPNMVRVAAVILLFYLISFIVGMVVGVSCGYTAEQALFESISATSNNGLTMGIAGPATPFALKVTYFIQMWLGRLEFLSVLATFAAVIASLKPVGKKSTHR